MPHLRPSAAHHWFYCFAQPTMVANLPEKPPSDPAMEGTCAAWVAEMVINGHVTSAAELIGKPHPENGWLVDVDMAHHVTRYVSMVREKYGDTVRAERFVRLNDNIAGTTDAWAALLRTADGKRVLVGIDLKYGFGVVEAYRNLQVSIYLAAIATQDGLWGQIDEFHIVIFQPRAYHPSGHWRSWTVGAHEFYEWAQAIILAGDSCQDASPQLHSGAHCVNCDAAATCPALAAANYRHVEHMRADTQRHMTPVELAAELRFLDMAEDMLKARAQEVRAEAEARIKRGETIFGYGLLRARAQSRLKYPADVVEMVTGVDARTDTRVTPAELRRRLVTVLPTGVNPDPIVNALSEKPDGALRLTAIPPDHADVAFGRN